MKTAEAIAEEAKQEQIRMEVEMNQYKTKNEALEDEKLRLTRERDALKAKVEAVKAENASQATKLTEAQASYDDLSTENATLLSKLQQTEAEVKKEQGTVKDLEAKLAEANKHIGDLKHQCTQLELDLRATKVTLEKVRWFGL